jgi:hypothetical protein
MKNQNHFSELTNAVLYDEHHHLLDDELGRLCRQHYELGICSEYTAGILIQRMKKHQLFLAFSGTPFRTPNLHDGELILGRDLYGNPARIPLQYLNAHTLLIANTGAGKTTMERFYALQMARHLRGLWLFDLRRRELRCLRRYLAAMGINLVVVPGRSMKINILQVPNGVEPSDFIPRIADSLVAVLGIPPRASKLIQSHLFRLYRRFGILEGRSLLPTIFDLFEEIKNDTKANPQARMALLDSLDPVLQSIGPNLCFRRGWTTELLSTRCLLFEFTGLTEIDKNIMLNYLLVSEFISRVARNISNPRLNLLVMFDEANRLVAGSPDQPSPIGDLIGLVRGTGIGLFLSAQSTSDLLPQVMANTSLKILGRVGAAGDYVAMGRAMGLDQSQLDWAIRNLRPGRFIGRASEGNWSYPFVFEVPQPKFDLNVHDQENHDDDNADPPLELPTVPA